MASVITEQRLRGSRGAAYAAELGGEDCFEEMIPLSQLRLPSYQRNLDQKHVRDMTNNFQYALLERLIVNQRPGDDSLWVVEGQHRLAVLRAKKSIKAPCLVHIGWTEDQERDVFEYRSKSSKPLTVFDHHHAGGPEAKDIDRVVESFGFRVARGPNRAGRPTTQISAITALRAIYRDKQLGGPAGLREVIQTEVKAWGNAPHMFHGQLPLGVHRFLVLAKADRAYTIDRFAVQMRRPHCTPDNILKDATARANTRVGSYRMLRSIVEVLVERYNHGLHGESRLSFRDSGLE
jgi:hypothetical protein